MLAPNEGERTPKAIRSTDMLNGMRRHLCECPLKQGIQLNEVAFSESGRKAFWEFTTFRNHRKRQQQLLKPLGLRR